MLIDPIVFFILYLDTSIHIFYIHVHICTLAGLPMYLKNYFWENENIKGVVHERVIFYIFIFICHRRLSEKIFQDRNSFESHRQLQYQEAGIGFFKGVLVRFFVVSRFRKGFFIINNVFIEASWNFIFYFKRQLKLAEAINAHTKNSVWIFKEPNKKFILWR